MDTKVEDKLADAKRQGQAQFDSIREMVEALNAVLRFDWSEMRTTGDVVMAWKTLRWDHLDTFRRQWPCHGLPADLHSISFEFAGNGDLVDVEGYDADGRLCVLRESLDGPALLALSQDAQKLGDDSD